MNPPEVLGHATAAPARPRSKRESVERLSSAVQSLGDLLPAQDLADLAVETEMAVTGSPHESAGVSVLTGEALPARAEVAAAQWRNLQRAYRQRERLLADAITVGEASTLLGVGRQAMHDRLRSSSLLAVKDRGQWRLPLWQFDPEGPDGILDGLPQALRALRGPISDLGKVRWFLAPKAGLDGSSPYDALRAGRADEVIRVAAALGAS